MKNQKPPEFECKDGMYLFRFTGFTVPPEGYVSPEPTFTHRMGTLSGDYLAASGAKKRLVDSVLMNQMYEDGIPYEKIAREWNISRPSAMIVIDNYRIMKNLVPRETKARASYKKLSQRVVVIAGLRANGKTPREVEEELDIPLRYVQKTFSRLKMEEIHHVNKDKN